MAYRMAPIRMTLSDVKGQLFNTFVTPIPSVEATTDSMATRAFGVLIICESTPGNVEML